MKIQNEKTNDTPISSDSSKSKKQKIITGICFGIVVAVLIAVFVFVGIPLLRLAKEPEEFRLWVDAKGVWGPVIYMGLVILQILIAFMPGEPFEIVAGYAFGTVNGTIYCLLGASVGSIMVVLLVRKFGVKLLEVFFSKEKIEGLKFLKSSPKRTTIFMLLFLIPGTPKDLLCYFAGLTDMPLPLTIFIVTICRFPSIITSTLGGDALGTGNYISAIIVFAVTLVISLVGILIYNKISAKHNVENSVNDDNNL